MDNLTELAVEEVSLSHGPSFILILLATLTGVAAVSGLILCVACCCCNNTTDKKNPISMASKQGKNYKKSKTQHNQPCSFKASNLEVSSLMCPENVVTKKIQPKQVVSSSEEMIQSQHSSHEDLLKASMYMSTMSLPGHGLPSSRTVHQTGWETMQSELDLIRPPYRSTNPRLPYSTAQSMSCILPTASCALLPGLPLKSTSLDYSQESLADSSGSCFHRPPSHSTPELHSMEELVAWRGKNQDDFNYKLGSLKFGLHYLLSRKALLVKVISATDLPKKLFVGTSDPYVKVALIPDKSKTSTTVKEDDLQPQWNEEFEFKSISMEKVLGRTVHFLVLDFDRFRKNNAIGELYVKLAKTGIAQLTKGVTMRKYIRPCLANKTTNGRLLLSMCYDQFRERLTLVVIKYQTLVWSASRADPDCYVTVRMTSKKKKLLKKQTSVVKSSSPVFNESFEFDVDYARAEDSSFHIKVIDKRQRGSHKLIGCVILGAKSGPTEVQHWNDTFGKPQQPVAEWHVL